MRQIVPFIKKEFLHIFRDPRTMMILLAMPIVQIVLFGFAISTEVKNSRLAVYDPAKEVATQQIIDRLDASEYFTLVHYLDSPSQIDQLMRRSKINMAVVFPHDFATNPCVQIVVDGSDPNTATIATNYAIAIINSHTAATSSPSNIAAASAPQFSHNSALPITANITFLYNPSMKSSYNFVPGVMGLILMLICAMMTSISIVREKERGTLEVLLVSPIHPLVIILAKVIPYFALSVFNLGTILLLAVFVLGVPISGSLVWLLIFSLIFIFVALALGLLISTIVETQVAAMLISGMVLMMPTVMLSGMMFPVENMPLPLQVISCALPARWYIDGVRKLMIQGAEIRFAIRELLILSAMAAVLIAVSLKKFKIRL